MRSASSRALPDISSNKNPSSIHALPMETLNSEVESGACHMFRKALLPIPLAAILLALSACGSSNSNPSKLVSAQDNLATATPIKHLVVIYGENRSFDNYFGTYPNATNPTGEPVFTPAAG